MDGDYAEILDSDDPAAEGALIASCTCGWESGPIWDDEIVRRVRDTHEATHRARDHASSSDESR